MLDLTKIDPKLHPRYSPNLYKWLSNRRERGRLNALVYRSVPSGTSGVEYPNGPPLYIGWKYEDGDFVGCRLQRVMALANKAELGSYGIHGFNDYSGFWELYARIGRCAVDPSHTGSFVNGDTRWLVEGDARFCTWCGNCTQRLHKWEEVVQRSAWRNEG